MAINFNASKPKINVPNTFKQSTNTINNIFNSNQIQNIDYNIAVEPITAIEDYNNSQEQYIDDTSVEISNEQVPVVEETPNTTITQEIVNKEALEELSKGLITTALNEYNNRGNRGEYEWYSSMEWCAAFATWVYKNTEINGQSAAEIAGLTNGDEWTPSTGRLMMHFYTADNPDLGFDYTNQPYYKGENPNIGFFYNDYASNYEGMNAELGKVSDGEKYIPKPGDFVFFNHAEGDQNKAWKPNLSGADSVQDHTGMVLDVKTDSEGNLIELTTIEGNISDNYYQRTIRFDGSDSYSEYVIGYGTIKNLPS